MAQHDRNGRITAFNFHFFTIICYMSRVEANQRFRFPREFLNPNETIAGLGWYSGPPISGGAERRPSYFVLEKVFSPLPFFYFLHRVVPILLRKTKKSLFPILKSVTQVKRRVTPPASAQLEPRRSKKGH